MKKKITKTKIEWDGCETFIRCFIDGKKFNVPDEYIENIKYCAVEDYKKELRIFLGMKNVK